MSQSDQESSSVAEATNQATANSCMMMACNERDETQATCDVLCSLGASSYSHDMPSNAYMDDGTDSSYGEKQGHGKGKGNACPKQHQLPMFLSKTYHMIDRCDPSIATWSAAGDNFVVKNVEKFATDVLPLYFKHSNFSSFARQLNFYGFRKLRTDPILTSDVDPRTACYVRFYHEKFQKDRPELLHQIKRATKSDQQSKDDVDSLKHEVSKLRDCLSQMSSEMDRKMAEMSYEYNRRITTLSAEYDKLAALVTQILARGQLPDGFHAVTTDADSATRVPDLMHSLSQVAVMSLHNQLRGLPPTTTTQGGVASSPGVMGTASASTLGAVATAAMFGTKRPLPDEDSNSGTTNRPRTG